MREANMVPRLFRSSASLLMLAAACQVCLAAQAPKLMSKDGRWALLVDGQPYLMLGGQVHNSSAWPSELPAVWKSLAELHANTVEAPVYWEQIESQQGQFNWDNVDAVVKGARDQNLHVVLLWFGTWKNGNMHYAPSWVKADPRRFARVIRADGEPIDVLSANSRANLDADKAAFMALMRHLKTVDAAEHTVLLVQVENESGIIGSPRDFSPESNKEFAGPRYRLTCWLPPNRSPVRGARLFMATPMNCFSSIIRRAT
jgi:beta-galactosidase GanA